MPLVRESRSDQRRVNLGSGNEPLSGYINVDRRHCPGVNVIADVRQLPFAQESIDRITASSVLEHFADPYAVLDEVHRILHSHGHATFRVPSPWSCFALMDPTHCFLADLKLWRQILAGYFDRVEVIPEGVRYRDNKLLALLNHIVVRCLRFFEFAQTWRFDCERKKPLTTRAYIPWWLETGQQKEPADLSRFSASAAVRSGPCYRSRRSPSL
jgi:SAM-dependent methyltransferase